jgi:FkbM family methyltransferase
MRHCPFNEYLPQMGNVAVVVEIGAYRMDDTAWMRGCWQTARIVCFEPDPRNVEHIYREQISSDLHAELYPYAVADRPGVLDFWQSTNLDTRQDCDWSQSGSLLKPTKFGTPENLKQSPCIYAPEPIRVKVVTLDDFLPTLQVGAVDLLWMDAQGAEHLILKGAKQTLARTRWIWTESNTDGYYEGASTLAKILAELPGWELVKTLDNDALLRNLSPC